MTAVLTLARVDAAATLHVDLAAVAANLRVLQGRTSAQLMAVVKADGFGHGAVAIARTAVEAGAGWLGVTSLAEAGALRDAGLDAPLLSWLNPVEADWRAAAAARIDVAVPGVEHLAAIARADISGPVRVHLHADVGLARDGAPAASWRTLACAARAAERSGTVQVVGLMGHLARAEEGPDRHGRRLFAHFVRTCALAGLRPRVRHLAATAATLTDPLAHYDLCRVGAGLVGIGPVDTHRADTLRLRPVGTLTAPVVGVREVRAGTGVGYGHLHLTTGPTTLALLALGYADGLPRAAAGHAEVLVRGRRCPVVGQLSMDQVVVDVGHLPVGTGEVATVLGPGDDGEPTVTEWATWAGTIPHEIVTGIGPRVVRSFLPAVVPR